MKIEEKKERYLKLCWVIEYRKSSLNVGNNVPFILKSPLFSNYRKYNLISDNLMTFTPVEFMVTLGPQYC